MSLDTLLKRLTETSETPHVSPDVSPKPSWIKDETPETCETCEKKITVATVSVANPWEGETVQAANDARQQRVEEMLASNPALKYALLVDDATSDPVLVTIGIRGLATFDMEIPNAHYDGIALLEVLDQHSTDTDLNPSVEANPLPIVIEHSHGVPGKQEKAA